METKYFGEFRDVYSKAAGDVYSKAVSEMYSKAVSEMYSQFNQREAHPMEKYIGRFANYEGEQLEVVGYSHNDLADEPLLIVDASQTDGWSASELKPFDVVFKECEKYYYVYTDYLIG